MLEYAQTAIFSGAGLSASLPAGLPLGPALRDLLLDLCYEEAHLLSPAAADSSVLDEVKRGAYKLEVILGRLAATSGPAALDVVTLLDVTVPNESHMLAALALANGGFHVTLNLDEGVEVAYGLLTGSAALPAAADPALSALLPGWRALVPVRCPPLSVIASKREFEGWSRRHSPGLLLKVHGSIRKARGIVRIVDPVVEDEPEYAGLAPARLAALDLLTAVPAVIVTGYSGPDIDVYDQLIERLAGTAPVWAAPDVAPRVHSDLAALPRARVIDGRPAGLAAVALRDLFGCASAPAWPQTAAPGPAFADRAASWAAKFRAIAPAGSRAEAYAWFLADIGRYDTAHELLCDVRRETGQRPAPRLVNRMADVRYDRHLPGDRRAAARTWSRTAFSLSGGRAERAYALTRLGEIGRGMAARGPVPVRAAGLAVAVLGPCAAVAIAGQADTRARARALSSLSGTGLRMVESVPPRLLPRTRPLTRLLVRAADAAGMRAQELAPGGNRLLFIRQQCAELALIRLLLTGQPSQPAVVEDLHRVRTAYERSGDIRGQANAEAALALAAIADRDSRAAKTHLDNAERQYALGRPGQPPDPSGMAVVSRRRRLARSCGLDV
jgi:hypothetical protein